MSNWSQTKINQVWNKGKVIPGENPNVKRKDACNAIIARSAFGDQNSKYGWEIDHIYPESRGGSDDLSNLQPLHWKNNRNKGNSLSNNYCCVNSRGNDNIDRCNF